VRGVTALAPDGSCILDDVSFSVQRGWLVAVMGPTGAGKTSLVRTLTGSLSIEAGEIRLDGQDLRQSEPDVRRRVGYVPQEDLLSRQLGLRRTLEYKASLRLPRSTGAAQRSRRVRVVLAELGLERQAGLAVDALSGGQRKRANLAVELLAQPDVLVLDEPTTGLDPGHERSVITTLREVADRGRTVLMVTHSMAVLSLCDRVMFLAAGGQVAFFGTPDGAGAYFAEADAASLFADLDSQTGQSWKDRWRSEAAQAQHSDPGQQARGSERCGRRLPGWEPVGPVARGAAGPLGGRAVLAIPIDRPPGWAHQLFTLVQRHLDLITSDRRRLVMLALQAPVLGGLVWAILAPRGLSPVPPTAALGLAHLPAVRVAVFLAISISWLGTASTIREIVNERQILQWEMAAGLSPNAYLTSKVAVLGLLIIIQAGIFTAIACIRQAPPAHGAVLGWGLGELIVTTALSGLAAVALGLLLSALVSTSEKALTILPVTLVAQLVLSGAWGSVAVVPGIGRLSDLTGSYWGVRAIEATVAGDAGAWWAAIVALTSLTVATLVATLVVVKHRTHSRGSHRWFAR
jgi:ABC-type multidrug transport system ATPase subunit